MNSVGNQDEYTLVNNSADGISERENEFLDEGKQSDSVRIHLYLQQIHLCFHLQLHNYYRTLQFTRDAHGKSLRIPTQTAWSIPPPSHTTTIQFIHVVNDAASFEPRILKNKHSFSASASGCALNLQERLSWGANSVIFEPDILDCGCIQSDRFLDIGQQERKVNIKARTELLL
jgi:hypothetical protein